MTSEAAQSGHDDATALCLACGMCCDGSMLDWAWLGPEDVEMAASTGLHPYRSGNSDRFPLPCPAFDGCCTRFSARPYVCGAYRCKLLLRIDATDVDLGGALTLVDEAKRLRNEAERLGIAGESRPAARHRWRDFFRASDPGDNPGWYLAMTAYNLFIDRHFRLDDTAMTAEE